MATILSPNMLAGFNARDQHVVTKVYEAYFPVIQNEVLKQTSRGFDIYDISTEIFTRVLESKKRPVTIEKLENYFKTAIFKECNNQKRERVKHEKNVYNILQHNENLQTRNVENEKKRRICDYLTTLAVEMLPTQAKQVYLLALEHELTNQQIAEQMGISIRTVEHHRSRAYGKLRKEIQRRPGTAGGMLLLIISLPFLVTYLIIQKILS